ncbi:hypothetical protein A6V39_04515 [Candidatus Mycoplasma haematobovis]|uniref:Uncharacterized protein n=1 Tax=Candidatus Mycoplasma haematobovis TaxID=432608 RepID=A0A1A9QD46_9MOLU|nr:hypothetical protein [Candidatus Mycoplasma haematobovis]OAL10148.1 hypothetical protein A6V39_04515 [Candidatus Mycoplasma haematobovis]
MTTFGKVVIGASTLGTLGGGAVLANSLLNKKVDEPTPTPQPTTSERLAKEGFDGVPTDGWQTILDAYQLVKDTKTTFKRTPEEVETLDGLKAKCLNALGDRGADEGNYKKARQWCVKTVTTKTVLNNLGYEILDSSDSKTDQDTVWKEIAKSLKLNPNSFPAIGEKVKVANNDDDVKELKAGCEALKLNEAKTTDKDFNDKLEWGKSWCSTPKTKEN